MKMINSFDPSTAASGFFQHQIANPCGGVYLFNESNQWLGLTLPDGGIMGLPAWWARFYHLESVQGPVLWQVLDTIATVASPLSKVYGESYERNEIVGRNFYDGPIPRNPYIANSVVSTVSTNSVENTGNPAGTNVVSATMAGSSGLNASILNDGTFFFAQEVASVYEKYFQGIPGASPVLELGANLIFQALDNSGNNLSNILGIDSSGSTFLQSHKTNQKTVIYSNTGVALLTVNDNTQGIEIPTSAPEVIGTTNGNAFGYMPFTGANFKVLMIVFNAYRNASGVSQVLSLPVAFSTWCLWMSGNGPFITPRLSGSNLTSKVRVVTGLGTGTGGTNTAESLLPPIGFGEIIQGFDAFDLGHSQGTNNSSVYFFIGQ